MEMVGFKWWRMSEMSRIHQPNTELWTRRGQVSRWPLNINILQNVFTLFSYTARQSQLVDANHSHSPGGYIIFGLKETTE